MFIIGLTGSIAVGKSFFAKCFLKERIPVFDADFISRSLYSDPKIISKISALFPEILLNSKLDIRLLSHLAFTHSEKLRSIEKILHPLIREKMQLFLRKNLLQKQNLVILEIPLLFETGLNNICDLVILVKANNLIQEYRFLKRKNGDKEKLKQILKKQFLNLVKEKKSDFILDTSLAQYRSFIIFQNILSNLNHLSKNARNHLGYRNYGFKCRFWR